MQLNLCFTSIFVTTVYHKLTCFDGIMLFTLDLNVIMSYLLVQ